MTSESTPVPAAWTMSDGDTAYLDKTLRYQPVELGLDESISLDTLKVVWLRGFLVSATVWLVFVVISVIVLVSGASGESSSSSSSELSTTAGIIFATGFLVAGLVFWLAVLAGRFTEDIAEWRVLLADRAMKADSVYSQISGTLRVRQYPLQGTIRRLRVGRGYPVTNRLALRDGNYTVYVSVFPYGTALYLGWTMWRSRRGATLLGQYLSDLSGGLAAGRDPERQMMRTERIRAMREAVHSACREGLHVATEGIDVSEQYGFPSGFPAVEDEFDSAPAFAVTPPAPGAVS